MTARTLFAVAVLSLAGPFAATAAAETPQEKATRLLNKADRAKGVLLFLHFGSDYVNHSLIGSGKVTRGGKDLPGHFYLEYKYNWKVGGETAWTTLYFLFDATGTLTEVRKHETTAEFNQLFLLANLSIKVIGEGLYDGLKDKLNDGDRRLLRKLIDDANAKGLLEFALALDLATSR